MNCGTISPALAYVLDALDLGLCFMFGYLIARNVAIIVENMLERARLRLKTEQLKDQLHRDACNTIHYLRSENDALTAMVSAMANGRSR